MTPTTERPSALRRGLRQTLIYFGLASEPEDPDQPAAPAPWWDQAIWVVFLGVGLTALAWEQRGAGIGLFSLVGFAILVAVNGPWPASERRQRFESAFALFVILPVGLAVLVPSSVDVWIPLGTGAAVAALLTIAVARQTGGRPRGDDQA